MNETIQTKRWNVDQDTLQEESEKALGWSSIKSQAFPYEHKRPLPSSTAQKAVDYIKSLTKGFPFQLRYVMALPLWTRFAEEWCDSGNEKKSLLAIYD